jgi:hypothetical protein
LSQEKPKDVREVFNCSVLACTSGTASLPLTDELNLRELTEVLHLFPATFGVDATANFLKPSAKKVIPTEVHV